MRGVFKVKEAVWSATRFSSACARTLETTVPIEECSNKMRHIHFKDISSFERGLDIQNQFLRAGLDHKNMVSNIKRTMEALAGRGAVISDYENGLVEKVLKLKPMPTVLTFEFNSVYTGGKREKKNTTTEDIAKYESMGCKYYQLERGGQVTYHGPGQLVVYPIIDLKTFANLPIRCYVSKLEQATINTLEKYGIKGETSENTGVWVNNGMDKIASIGVNVNRSITSFGMALNISPELKYLNAFPMCGLPDKRASSMLELGKDISVKDAGVQFVSELQKLLNIKTVELMEIHADDIKPMTATSKP